VAVMLTDPENMGVVGATTVVVVTAATLVVVTAGAAATVVVVIMVVVVVVVVGGVLSITVLTSRFSVQPQSQKSLLCQWV